MELSDIQCVTIDEPTPTRIARGRPAVGRDTMFTLLGTMEVGGVAIEVNRALRSVQGYVHRFRMRQADVDPQYVLRVGRPGWTKIWRVK
jgi:acetaldehyde dehydrogenase (acetylating)